MGSVEDTQWGKSGPTTNSPGSPHEEGLTRIHADVTWEWSPNEHLYRPAGTVVFEYSHTQDGARACMSVAAPYTMPVTALDGTLEFAPASTGGVAGSYVGYGLLHAL